MAGNAHAKKEYNHTRSMTVSTGLPPKKASAGVRPGKSVGQISDNLRLANPMNDGVPAGIQGLDGTYNDIGELSGFVTDGYLDKNGTPYGEAAKFNYMPPGMDIGNQVNSEIHDMPMRKLVAESYPGDGWTPAPRDIPE